jgi:pimeloyl-ACP methyl ester carboxylesterase
MTTPRWRTGTVASGGESIYFEVTGDDDTPAILLTHGAGGSHAAWFQQVPALTAAGYRVITWDCRGFGNSTFTSGAHGTDAAVADMRAVLDATDTSAAHLAGQSMGGWWVTAFTLASPERVHTLTLSNTIGGLWTDALFAHFTSLSVPQGSDEQRLGVHPALGTSFVERDPAGAFLYQQLNTFHTPPMGDVIGALVGNRVEHAALDVTGVPILVISGTDDVLFPAPLVAESAALLANATYVEVADAGHSPYFERPDDYNDALLQFIGKHSA